MEANALTLEHPKTLPVPAEPRSKRSQARRNTTIELARLLAALGVIAAHLPGDTNGASWFITTLAPLRVPFFYSLSLFMFVASLPQTTPQRVASRLWHRTLIPYLSWTLLYETLIIAKTLLTHGHHEPVWWRILLYGESAVQLFFLPTLLMMQVVALGIHLLLAPGSSQRPTGWLLLAGGSAYYAWGAYCHCFGIGGLNSLPAYAAYLLVAFWLAPLVANQRGQSVSITVAGGGMVLLAVCCNGLGYCLPMFGYPLIMPLGGVGALLLTTGLPSQWQNSWLLTATSFSFGIYLCHPLIIEMFEFVVQHVYPVAISYTSGVKIVEIVAVFTASSILVLALRRVKPVRRMLLGEG